MKASLNGHNFSSVGPLTLILWFSESLERGLSDDLLKSKVYFGLVFDKIEIMARFKIGIWAYHLNRLLLSFQKIVEFGPSEL